MTTLTQAVFEHIPYPFFTMNELKHLLPGTDSSRYARINRALQAKEIIQVRRGLYVLAPMFRKVPLNTRALAQIIYGPSYISLESALSRHGLIPEAVYTLTSVSYGKSKSFDTPLGNFSYTRIPQRIFFAGVERLQENQEAPVFMANPLKALLDYIYVHKVNWKDLTPLFYSLRIEPEDLRIITTAMAEELENNYTSRRVQKFLMILRKELGL